VSGGNIQVGEEVCKEGNLGLELHRRVLKQEKLGWETEMLNDLQKVGQGQKTPKKKSENREGTVATGGK